jgi:hypothetical protein
MHRPLAVSSVGANDTRNSRRVVVSVSFAQAIVKEKSYVVGGVPCTVAARQREKRTDVTLRHIAQFPGFEDSTNDRQRTRAQKRSRGGGVRLRGLSATAEGSVRVGYLPACDFDSPVASK